MSDAVKVSDRDPYAEWDKLGFKVVKALDQYVDTTGETREWDGKYHPSSMFQCERKVVYNVRGIPVSEGDDKKSKRRFYIGHRLHEVVQQAVDLDPRVQGFYSEFEADIDALNISGHGDGLILFMDGSWVLLEIKSIRRAGFKFGLRPENVNQAKVYALAARKYGIRARSVVTGLMEDIPPLGDRLRGVLIVYVEKEDLDVREHFIPWNDLFEKQVMDKLQELDAYRDDPKSLPPRLPLDANGKKNWQCRFCPFQTQCWTKDTNFIPPGEELPF